MRTNLEVSLKCDLASVLAPVIELCKCKGLLLMIYSVPPKRRAESEASDHSVNFG